METINYFRKMSEMLEYLHGMIRCAEMREQEKTIAMKVATSLVDDIPVSGDDTASGRDVYNTAILSLNYALRAVKAMEVVGLSNTLVTLVYIPLVTLSRQFETIVQENVEWTFSEKATTFMDWFDDYSDKILEGANDETKIRTCTAALLCVASSMLDEVSDMMYKA